MQFDSEEFEAFGLNSEPSPVDSAASAKQVGKNVKSFLANHNVGIDRADLLRKRKRCRNLFLLKRRLSLQDVFHDKAFGQIHRIDEFPELVTQYVTTDEFSEITRATATKAFIRKCGGVDVGKKSVNMQQNRHKIPPYDSTRVILRNLPDSAAANTSSSSSSHTTASSTNSGVHTSAGKDGLSGVSRGSSSGSTGLATTTDEQEQGGQMESQSGVGEFETSGIPINRRSLTSGGTSGSSKDDDNDTVYTDTTDDTVDSWDESYMPLEGTVDNGADADYINASYVTSYDKGFNRYIVTQAPMEHTIGQFWHMVLQDRCRMIVSLVDVGDECDRFWPTRVGGTEYYEPIHVKLLAETEVHERITKRTLRIRKRPPPKQKSSQKKENEENVDMTVSDDLMGSGGYGALADDIAVYDFGGDLGGETMGGFDDDDEDGGFSFTVGDDDGDEDEDGGFAFVVGSDDEEDFFVVGEDDEVVMEEEEDEEEEEGEGWGEPLEVIQWHYHQWSDMTAPSDVESLLSLIALMDQEELYLYSEACALEDLEDELVDGEGRRKSTLTTEQIRKMNAEQEKQEQQQAAQGIVGVEQIREGLENLTVDLEVDKEAQKLERVETLTRQVAHQMSSTNVHHQQQQEQGNHEEGSSTGDDRPGFMFNDEVINPVVVHCSAGVGRAGTFVASRLATEYVRDYKMHTGEVPETINMAQLVYELRAQRPFMVYKESQYSSLYDIVYNYSVFLTDNEEVEKGGVGRR